MSKKEPMTLDVMIKTSDVRIKYAIESFTVDMFLDEGIKYYQIGNNISLRLENGDKFLGVIKDIRFWPSEPNNNLVLEIFVDL